ncbi:MAG: hypothetical protein EOP93_07650 [Lysobacteraceae bacterium]|nr:MAG: hypothetical protein EOP93_07650 [Xanthomonadaceae bacterium]
MPIHLRLRLFALAALTVCVAACAPPPLPFARLSGLITDGDLDEVSGMAASQAHDDVLWAIEDSGNPARLYALSRRGRVLARYKVEGARNIDWEDMASFDLDGRHYLLVADTGDNGGQRRDFVLHVFEEPKTLRGGTLRPAWSIRARWADGPRDCEAVAVDAVAGKVLLVSHGEWREARRIGRLADVPEADADLQRSDPKLAKLSPQVTAADLSPDGRTLAVLTYGSVLFYRRQPGEDWGEAVGRAPEAHDVPLIPQAEALAWSKGGGGLYASGEFRPAPIFYLSPDL